MRSAKESNGNLSLLMLGYLSLPINFCSGVRSVPCLWLCPKYETLFLIKNHAVVSLTYYAKCITFFHKHCFAIWSLDRHRLISIAWCYIHVNLFYYLTAIDDCYDHDDVCSDTFIVINYAWSLRSFKIIPTFHYVYDYQILVVWLIFESSFHSGVKKICFFLQRQRMASRTKTSNVAG